MRCFLFQILWIYLDKLLILRRLKVERQIIIHLAVVCCQCIIVSACSVERNSLLTRKLCEKDLYRVAVVTVQFAGEKAQESEDKI